MKVSKRSICKDELAFEHEGYQVHVHTHRNEIVINVQLGILHYQKWLSADEFIDELLAITRKP